MLNGIVVEQGVAAEGVVRRITRRSHARTLVYARVIALILSSLTDTIT